jgi:hypothetical protein
VTHYRCYFVGESGATAWRAFVSESDGEAQDHALGLFAGYPYAEKMEVWEGGRLTFGFRRSWAQTPTQLRRLCYLAIEAAKKETDPEVKRTIASCAAKLAQAAEALERKSQV